MKKRFLLLADIRSSENVGSLFRTADALGLDGVICAGITPMPKDRFGRENKKVTKASLGAEKTLYWEGGEIFEILRRFKKEGYFIVAIEQDKNSIHYAKVKIKPKTLFILGNETQGLSKEVLRKADVIAEIPMKGKKESLNVAVSGGIALFRMLGN